MMTTVEQLQAGHDMLNMNDKTFAGFGRYAFAVMVWAVASGASFAGAARADVPVTIVNYSQLPVHATAITLDAKSLEAKLGLTPDSPIEIRDADGKALPIARGLQDGKPVLQVFLSMPPASRRDLIVSATKQGWRDYSLTKASCAPDGSRVDLRNGVVNFTVDKKGWGLAFDAPGTNKPALIKDGVLDFWVDTQSRGRIMNGNPKDFGLLQFSANAHFEKCEAFVATNGRPVFVRTSRFDGFAKGLAVIDTFELVPGMPLLIARVRWQNDGDAPLWIAYAGSGDGIRGRWSKDLMPTPLIERKKSPIMGDLNGGETRCAWVGGLCRVTMESPATGCGIGMSTLLPTPGKVGQGSMVWGCSGSGFQCNFIDPEVGQFPFLVKPHGKLDNGFAFLATQAGVSVHRQTVALWGALQKEKLPDLAPPCAVFVGGEPVRPQAVGELADVPALWITNGASRQIALRLDLNKNFECRVSVESASPQGTLEITAQRMASSKPPITILRAERSGDFAIDLNRQFTVTDEVAMVIEAKVTGAAKLKSFVISETLPASPVMLSPVDGVAMTDLAAMFRWCSLPMVVDYDLQYSRSADFASPVSVRVTSSEPYPWYLVSDDQLPAPGKWFWRIRGVKGNVTGAWSPTRNFTVNNDYATRPVKRPLTAKNPLFTLEATRVLDFTTFHPDIPSDIAPNVGIIAEGMEGKGLPVTDFARGMEKLPHAIMLRSHWVGLADIEWLFQHVPNFVGIQGGEHLSDLYRDSPRGEMRYAHRLLRLCAKYGMFFQEADGTYKDDKWQDLMDQQGKFVREFGPWLVLSQKNNIIRRQFYSQSAAMGLWLGGITHGHGAWEDGGFYWQNAGFKELGTCVGERSGDLRTMPRIFWDLVCVMGIARGCGIYSLDGQTLMDSSKLNARDPKMAWASAIWDETGKTTETFSRFVVPLIRGTVKHELIPSRDEVLKNVRLAVFNDMKGKGDVKTWPHYAEYGALYAGTYGFRKMGNIDGQLWEFFPNTGRYYFIPVLPQGNEPLGARIRNLPISELQDTTKVAELFNTAYQRNADGEAFVTRVAGTLIVMNTRENEDVTETFSVPIAAGPVSQISGALPPHAYLIGRMSESLWLQFNGEHAGRDLELWIACPRKPDIGTQQHSSMQANEWDDAAKRLKLRLSPRQGAVEIEIR